MTSYLPSPESFTQSSLSQQADAQRQRVASAGSKIKASEVAGVANSAIGIVLALLALGLLPFFWPGSIVLLLLILVAK